VRKFQLRTASRSFGDFERFSAEYIPHYPPLITKIESPVANGSSMDLSSLMVDETQECFFRTQSVANRDGTSVDRGHYRADTCQMVDGEPAWKRFDDENVSSQTVYLLALILVEETGLMDTEEKLASVDSSIETTKAEYEKVKETDDAKLHAVQAQVEVAKETHDLGAESVSG
jgi:hypothetical protein